jgi:polysaccharide pyruvyl transferase WcaK-like protein
VLQNLRNRWPHAKVIAFTMNPVDTYKRHHVPSYAIRLKWKSAPHNQKAVSSDKGFKARVKRETAKYRKLFALLRAINRVTIETPKLLLQESSFLVESFFLVKDLDLLVISGGGQLLDSWGGPWAFPYTIFKWVILAKLAHVKCYFVNVGAGPLEHSLSKWFVKRSLFAADYVSFRDGNSQTLVEQIGFSGKSDVSVDCVYSLDLSIHHTTNFGGQNEAVVGFSPMAYCDPRVYWDENQNIYDNYIEKLASFGEWLVNRQHRIQIFSTEISFDAHAIEDLTVALRNRVGASASIGLGTVDGFSELISVIRSSDYVITCRYHGVILAHLMNKPVLAISHHHKVMTLMGDLGFSEYCVDIRKFDLNLLADTFTRLIENRDQIKDRMDDKAKCYNRELMTQFDRLFPR